MVAALGLFTSSSSEAAESISILWQGLLARVLPGTDETAAGLTAIFGLHKALLPHVLDSLADLGLLHSCQCAGSAALLLLCIHLEAVPQPGTVAAAALEGILSPSDMLPELQRHALLQRLFGTVIQVVQVCCCPSYCSLNFLDSKTARILKIKQHAQSPALLHMQTAVQDDACCQVLLAALPDMTQTKLCRQLFQVPPQAGYNAAAARIG